MKCIKDSGHVSITHTYSGGMATQTKRGVCDKCGTVYTITSVMQAEVVLGASAYALAQRLRRAAAPVPVPEELAEGQSGG